MKTELCRRQFVVHGLVLAGAAVLLPAQRLAAAVAPATSAAPGAAALPAAVRALIAGYGTIQSVSSDTAATRITVLVHDLEHLAVQLGTARRHGIHGLRASGNLATFSMGGRQFELENRVDAA